MSLKAQPVQFGWIEDSRSRSDAAGLRAAQGPLESAFLELEQAGINFRVSPPHDEWERSQGDVRWDMINSDDVPYEVSPNLRQTMEQPGNQKLLEVLLTAGIAELSRQRGALLGLVQQTVYQARSITKAGQ